MAVTLGFGLFAGIVNGFVIAWTLTIRRGDGRGIGVGKQWIFLGLGARRLQGTEKGMRGWEERRTLGRTAEGTDAGGSGEKSATQWWTRCLS